MLARRTHGVARVGFRAARGAGALGTTAMVEVFACPASHAELLAGVVGEVEAVVAVLLDIKKGDPVRDVAVLEEEGVLGDAGGGEEGLQADAAWGERAGHAVRSVTAGRHDRRLWSVGRSGGADRRTRSPVLRCRRCPCRERTARGQIQRPANDAPQRSRRAQDQIRARARGLVGCARTP